MSPNGTVRLAVLMCVGAGEAQRHLPRALPAAREWADEVIVYGDGPDPETRALILRLATRTRIAARSLHAQGEHLVRNELLRLADDTLAPNDLVLVLDADEIVAGDRDSIRDRLTALERSPYASWCVQFRHLWAPDGSVHRVDGMWQPSIGPRLYRHQHGLRVAPLWPGGWVCHPFPPQLSVAREPVLTIDHWGYALPSDRPAKHDRYSRLPGHHPAHVASILDEHPVLEPVR